MKPGATARPAASTMNRRVALSSGPIAAMRSPRMRDGGSRPAAGAVEDLPVADQDVVVGLAAGRPPADDERSDERPTQRPSRTRLWPSRLRVARLCASPYTCFILWYPSGSTTSSPGSRWVRGCFQLPMLSPISSPPIARRQARRSPECARLPIACSQRPVVSSATLRSAGRGPSGRPRQCPSQPSTMPMRNSAIPTISLTFMRESPRLSRVANARSRRTHELGTELEAPRAEISDGPLHRTFVGRWSCRRRPAFCALSTEAQAQTVSTANNPDRRLASWAAC